MRRFAVVPALAAFLVLAFAGPAGAQQICDEPGYPPCPEAAAIQVSDATLDCPQPFVVSGQGFVPGDTVSITFDGQSIGSATVNSQGQFSANVTAPDAAAGSHTVTASNTDSASATVTCVGAAAAQPGVAFTGTNITVGLLMLVGLVVAGAAALLVGRRRQKVDA